MATEMQLDQEKLEAFVERIVLDAGTAMRGRAHATSATASGSSRRWPTSRPVTPTELAAAHGPRRALPARVARRDGDRGVRRARQRRRDATRLPPSTPAAGRRGVPLLHRRPPADDRADGHRRAARSPRHSGRAGRHAGSSISPDMYEAIERLTAPWYKHNLVQTWIPAMPDVQEKLQAGGSACDVGCGSGRAPITIAKAFAGADVARRTTSTPARSSARGPTQKPRESPTGLLSRLAMAPSCDSASSTSSVRSTSYTTRSTRSG